MHFCSTSCCRQFSEQPSRFLLSFTSKSDSFHPVLMCPVLNKPVIQGVRAVFKGGQTIDFCCTDCVKIFIVDLDRLTAHRDNLFGLKERLGASASTAAAAAGGGCCSGPPPSPPPPTTSTSTGPIEGGGGVPETPSWISLDHQNQPLGNANDIPSSSMMINPQHHELALLQQHQRQQQNSVGNVSGILPPHQPLGNENSSRSLASAATAALVATSSLSTGSPLRSFHPHHHLHPVNSRSPSSTSSSPAAVAGTVVIGGGNLATGSHTSNRSSRGSVKRSHALTVLPRPPGKRRKFTCELVMSSI